MLHINHKLTKILSDPRNKLGSLLDSKPLSAPSSAPVGANTADVEFGSRELDNLKERAFMARQPSRRLSFSLSFRAQDPEEKK
jgi:hypothetical protein